MKSLQKPRTVICDLEANGLTPDKIWCIVCKDVDTGENYVFHPYLDLGEHFRRFASSVGCWIGHNFLGYDIHALASVLNINIAWQSCLDTLVLSRLIDTLRPVHSLESWGATLNRTKLHTDIEDWSKFTPEMEERCISDVEVNFLLYQRFLPYIQSERWKAAIETESYINFLSHTLHTNGFSFDTKGALELKDKIDKEIKELEKNLKVSFLPKVSLVREVTPRATKFGTIAKNSIPKSLGTDLTPYQADAPFSLIEFREFNPRSPKDRVERLWEAGWQPVNKTKTHREVEKELQQLKRKYGKLSRSKRNNIRTGSRSLVNQTRVPGFPQCRAEWDGGPSGLPPRNKNLHVGGRQNSYAKTPPLESPDSQIDETTNSARGVSTYRGWKQPSNPTAETVEAISGASRMGGSQDTPKTSPRPPEGQPEALIEWLEARLGEYGVSGFGYTGWMATDEENLASLPASAPPALQTLVRFVLLTNRSSTLESWLKAVGADGKIHGQFHHIGAWTQRMSHSDPNMGNIPKFDAKQPHKTPYSDVMRSLWRASDGRYLIGVDAESIQLRIFGHYIDDQNFINALIAGKKEDASDPHSLNQKALGAICRSRDDAKTFIYAWLLGAGIAKVAQILECSRDEAVTANENFLEFYPGLKYLKEHIVPYDAARGYFEGFDGRYVRIFGDDVDSRRHFALAGYLQNGEVQIMKRAVQIWYPKLQREKIPFWWVNFVHDEYQIETIRDMEVAGYVATTVADAIRQVGVDFGLRCPMAGSVLNGHGKLAIGDNWMQTH